MARITAMAFVMLPLALAFSPAARAEEAPIAVEIDATKPSEPVTPYLYGMFIEPIGNLVARTMWAEMIDDRKFYYPVVPERLDQPAPINPEGRPGQLPRKWRPIGGDDAVAMDAAAPFVGKHSPRVTLASGSPRGMAQSGIALQAGRRYSGLVWIAGDPVAKVSVALVWGEGADQRQTIAMPALGAEWSQVPLAFTPGASATDARIEIVGEGSGSFRVGAITLMPADNLNGWRADVVANARSLNSGFWRLPGGNFLSGWNWRKAIGPRDRRPPVFDHAWTTMQPNDLGMDEWLDLTRLLKVEPYVSVNAGFGDANSAADLVEYINGAPGSKWGAVRAANGHPAPYAVHYWNIGNEPYGWWQLGKTSLDYYVLKHNEFAEEMKAVDPSIELIASGAMPDQLKPKDTKENASLQSIQPKFGTEFDWTGGLLARSYGTFSGISEHWYDRNEVRPDAPRGDELLEYARSPSNQVRMKAEIWKIYQRKFPAMVKDRIYLSMDEYAYFGPANLKNALAYSMVMQEMLRHSDFLKMAAFTTGASTMDITPHGSVLNTTGLVFKLYGERFGAGTIPVAVNGKAPQPDPKFPVGFSHPRVNAGSPTWPLDVVAALSPDRRSMRIGVVNATFQPQRLKVAGTRLAASGRSWTLTGASLEAGNSVGKTPGVTIREGAATLRNGTLSVPATATVVFEFPLEK